MPIEVPTLFKGEIPNNFDEYKSWLEKQRAFNATATKSDYALVVAQLKREMEESVVWRTLLESSEDYSSQYNIQTNLELFYKGAGSEPELLTKSFESFLEKTYRYSFVKKNKLPPGFSSDKLPLPSDYFAHVDDLVRTTVVVKFLDGVDFILGKLRSICEQNGLTFKTEYKCSDEGYFAAHYYIWLPISVHTSLGTFQATPLVEIQITTQLQEVLRRFLHFQYEKSRNTSTKPSATPWQWRYREEDFFTNYLGHMLRNIEGQIMEARRKRNIRDANA